MTKTYKFISMLEMPNEGRKTRKFNCVNNRSHTVLGEIKWHAQWRQYCYFPTVQAVYSKGCLNDIEEFIKHISV